LSFKIILIFDFLDSYSDESALSVEQSRNIYYQKQSANQIINQVNEIISLLTSTLNINLNIGQNTTMNTSQVFMSLETKLIESLSNIIIKQVGNAQIHLPLNFKSNTTNNQKISIRVCVFRIISLILFLFFIIVNDATISFIW